MPLADYHPAIRPYTGLIEWAVNNGLTATQTRDTLKATLDQEGVSLPFSAYPSVFAWYRNFKGVQTRAAGIAAQIEQVRQSGQDQAISANNIGPAPWGPALSEWSANQRLRALVPWSVETPLGREGGYFPIDFGAGRLQTIGQLLEEAQTRAGTSGTDSPPMDAELGDDIQVLWF